MEVRSANIALTNRAAAAIDNSGSNGKEQQHAMKVSSAVSEENQEPDEQSVTVSISAAGLRRSMQLEKQAEQGSDEEEEGDEEGFTGETELEDMMKKMEGLSSQIINGHFSVADRLNFHTEIERLTNELKRLNDGNTAVTKNNCIQLAQRISDLTRSVSDAAVYRNSARTVSMVNSRQPAKPMNTRLDIIL